MTLKIGQIFEKINNISSQKLAKKDMNLVTKKDHNKCKISYMKLGFQTLLSSNFSTWP